jgi:radical SAM superfamily enzyme YgiQ (UPF0313 family)
MLPHRCYLAIASRKLYPFPDILSYVYIGEMMSKNMKRVVLIQPESEGGNFEYVAIPRQGMLFLSGALKQWDGQFLYDREIWFEDRCGKIDVQKDLEGVDILMISALINEAPRAYEIARQAKECHPSIITVGGGPHMSPLSEEAMQLGHFDVIAKREGEDIIGQLSDVLLTLKGADRLTALRKIPGISFKNNGHVEETLRRGLVSPDFVQLPDYYSIRDLTPLNPMAAGVLETVRGCTEKCTYCQVIQQFLGYRMVARETEIKRLHQLQELANDNLIHTGKDGRFSVFISDDLHPPPLRAVKYRNERLERIKSWSGHSDNMWLVCQARAEVGQDPELSSALREAGVAMLYLGVESDNIKNLELVKKRQEPGQVYKDMTKLNELGFTVVAMTIIGLPFDTEETIMDMAKWVTQISRFQTANFLTPLPATSNWNDLIPLDEHGQTLEPGAIRPYKLYTGRQFVHKDDRWTMQESRELFDRYYGKLNPVDKLYARIFRMIQYYKTRLDREGKAHAATLSARVAETRDALNTLSDSTKMEIAATISQRINDVGAGLRNLSDAAAKELSETISSQVGHMSRPLEDLTQSSRSLSTTLSLRVNELTEAIKLMALPQRTPAAGQ